MRISISTCLRTAALAAALTAATAAQAYTYTYHIIDNAGAEASAPAITGQSAGAEPVLPAAMQSPLVSEYQYYTGSDLSTPLTALPAADADIYVRYTVNTEHRVKLDGSTWYNFGVHERYYKWKDKNGNNNLEAVNITDGTSKAEDRLWKITGEDPYNIKIVAYDGSWLYFPVNRDATTGYISSFGAAQLSTTDACRLMILVHPNGSSVNSFTVVNCYDADTNKDGRPHLWAIGGNNSTGWSLTNTTGIESRTGAQYNFGGGTRVWFDDLPVNFTYRVIDSHGHLAVSTTVEQAAMNGLPAYLQSPYAKNFTYYTTATTADGSYTIDESSAVALGTGFSADQTIYARYQYDPEATVTMTGVDGAAAPVTLDLTGKQHYNMKVNNGWCKPNTTSYNVEKTTGSLTATTAYERDYQWRFYGEDPYCVTIVPRAVSDKAIASTATVATEKTGGVTALQLLDPNATNLTVSTFMVLPQTENAIAIAAHGIEVNGVDKSSQAAFFSGAANALRMETRKDYWQQSAIANNGFRVRLSPVEANRRYAFHVVHPSTGELLYTNYGNFPIDTDITLPDDWQRPFCTYDGKFYTDQALTAQVTQFFDLVTADDPDGVADIDLYYTYALNDRSSNVFTTWAEMEEDDPDILWFFLDMDRQSGNYFVSYQSTGGNAERVVAQDSHRVPDYSHQWALVGNPYVCYLMNRQVNADKGGYNYAAKSDNPQGSTSKYIDFKAGHDDNKWGLIKPNSGSTANYTFTLRYHKANDTVDDDYFSAGGSANDPLRTSTSTAYTTMTAHPVRDFNFIVHKHTGGTLERTEAQPMGEDIELDSESLLFRKYCNYTFYADWDYTAADQTNAGSNPMTVYPGNEAGSTTTIHVAYTVSDDLPVKAAKLDDLEHAQWYLLIWDAESAHQYVAYNPANNSLHRIGNTRPDEIINRDQFAFVGDPYDLQVVNRYVWLEHRDEPWLLGTTSVSASTLPGFYAPATDGLHSSWQVTHTTIDAVNTNPERFTLFVRDGNYNTVGQRWYLNGTSTDLKTTDSNVWPGNPFILEEIRPTVEVRFHLYDAEGDLKMERTYGETYEVGTTVTKLHDEMLRGLCDYTYYSSSDVSGTGATTLSRTLTEADRAGGVDIYAKYTVTADYSQMFSPWYYTDATGTLRSTSHIDNALAEGNTLDESETYADAHWFFFADASGENYKFRSDVDATMMINGLRTEADEKDPYVWALIGDPYRFRVLNFYSGEARYLQYANEARTRFNVADDANLDDAITWEVMAQKDGVRYGTDEQGHHWFSMRLQGSYERDEFTPKYLNRYTNAASLDVNPVALQYQVPANFRFMIYSADDMEHSVLEADLHHTYAVGDMVHGLPTALQRQFCSYEYYADDTFSEANKFDTTVGAEARAAEGSDDWTTVYVKYTVSDEGKALFSTAEAPVWLNLEVNNFWSYDNLSSHDISTDLGQGGTADLKKSYQWRAEGDPYRFMLFNRRGGEGKYLGIARGAFTATGNNPISFVEYDATATAEALDLSDPYRYWAMKLPTVSSADRFILKVSDVDRVWRDTEYLRVYLTRSTAAHLTANRQPVNCGLRPVEGDVVDVTIDVRNEQNTAMVTRTLQDRKVGDPIAIDDRDRRFSCSYTYYTAIDDESGAIIDDAGAFMTPVESYTAAMDGHTVYTYYDYDRDLFSNDDVFNWRNWHLTDDTDNYWTYWSTGGDLAYVTDQAHLEDEAHLEAVSTGGLWALMGDPYRFRLVNFLKTYGTDQDTYNDEVHGYLIDIPADKAGFKMRNEDDIRDAHPDLAATWPAFWDGFGADNPEGAVMEYLVNPATGKGYVNSRANLRGHEDESTPFTLQWGRRDNGNTFFNSSFGYREYVTFVPPLKNATKITYHLVIGEESLRPEGMRDNLTGSVEHYGVYNTLTLPRSLRRQYLDYHFIDAEGNEHTRVEEEWDGKTIDLDVTYTLREDAPFRFSTDLSTLQTPHWYNIITVPGYERMLQNQMTAGTRSRYNTVDEHTTNDFWWAVQGDPYGFRLISRYAANNDMSMAIMGVDELTMDDGIAPAGNARVCLDTDGNDIHVFEMLIGGYKGYFAMHPVVEGLSAQKLMSTTSRVPVQLVQANSLAKSNSDPNGNWTFRSLASQLKQHFTYAGYGFGLDYDTAYDDSEVDASTGLTNRQLTEKILAGDDLTAAEQARALALIDAAADHYADDGLEEGYYRLLPRGPIGTDPRFASGYLMRGEIGPAATAQRVYVTDELTTADVEHNVLFDPSSIFHVTAVRDADGSRVEGVYRFTTQGLYFNDSYMSVDAPDYDIHIQDLGAATIQIRVADKQDDPRNYLSFERWNDTRTVSGNIELNEHSVTHLQDTKWRLQRVTSSEEMLDEDNGCNRLPLRLKMIDGGDGYYYSSFYVPYDVLLPEGAVAFTSRAESSLDDDGTPRVVCYSTGYDLQDSEQYGDFVGNDRFVPAGTPVVVRKATVEDTDPMTGAPYITLTLPNTQPSPAVNSDNVFRGVYLTQGLNQWSDWKDIVKGHQVYVLGVSSKKGIGFYRNANIDPRTGAKDNTYVLHNKAFYISNPYAEQGGATPSSMPMLMKVYGEQPQVITGLDEVPVATIDWNDSEVYDTLGRRVHGKPDAHGVYIVVTRHADGSTTSRKVRL